MEAYVVVKARLAVGELCSDVPVERRIDEAFIRLVEILDCDWKSSPEEVTQVLERVARLDEGSESVSPRKKRELVQQAIEEIFVAWGRQGGAKMTGW